MFALGSVARSSRETNMYRKICVEKFVVGKFVVEDFQKNRGEGGVINHSIFVTFVSIFILNLCCVCNVYHTSYLSLCFTSYITLSVYLYSAVVMYPPPAGSFLLIMRVLLE